MSGYSNESAITSQYQAGESGWLDRMARKLVLNRIAQLAHGQIIVIEGDSKTRFGEPDAEFPVPATVIVNDIRFYREVAFGAATGSGEAFIRHDWDTDNLSYFLRLMLRNRDMLETVDAGTELLSRPVNKLLHFLNRNTRSGSRRNIAAHYDLGNDFYQLWLDPRMMYSSAWFATPDMSLEDASTAKLERICQQLELKADDAVVEIGSGWGGFAIYAASKYGCHVTTTTISKEQHDFARARIVEAGLEDKITLLSDDYRDLEGKFDKLVSIEMIEAVGHQFHDTFFRKCCDLLKPNGSMLLQAITMADQRYEGYKNSVDFINKYIFPGGCLTSVTGMTQSMTENTNLRVIYLDDFGPHYAKTLRCWRERFFRKLAEVKRLGYSDDFIRLWQFYLCYCEAAFDERAIGVVHLHAIKS